MAKVISTLWVLNIEWPQTVFCTLAVSTKLMDLAFKDALMRRCLQYALYLTILMHSLTDRGYKIDFVIDKWCNT